MDATGLPRLGPLRLPEDNPERVIARRIGLALLLLLVVALLLWFTRGGLRDNAHPDRLLTPIDVFYFTVVSLTTLGYGDIAPVTADARLINALLLTPVRLFLWTLFLGTSYELTVIRLHRKQERQMRELHERLRDHIIVCGYGVKGRAIVGELLAQGETKANIVVIDPNEQAIADANRDGLIGLRGDASAEALLRDAAVERAAAVLVAPNRDDASVLIALTVRGLAPGVKLIAAAREEENIKLLYTAGANLVISPSVTGGRLMAAAVEQQAAPYFLEDLLSAAAGIGLAERVVLAEERGKLAHELTGLERSPRIGVFRGNQRINFAHLSDLPLEPGDVVVYLVESEHAHPDFSAYARPPAPQSNPDANPAA